MVYLFAAVIWLIVPASIWYDIRRHKLEIIQETAPASIDYQAEKQVNREIQFCNKQLEILYRMKNDAETAYNAALATVVNDSKMNQYCMVIPQKIVLTHIRERDKAANKLLTARNKINNMELKKIKISKR